MADISKGQFIREFSKKLQQQRAAAFIGAGMSCGAGFVNWRELLADIANDLGLEVDREHDLIAVAQFHQNEWRTRSKLNEKLIEEFTRDAALSPNHALLARLPIHTIWTTNYDELLEDAFRREGKRVDAKVAPESLAWERRDADVTIYKMHGDISRPDQAVLTKDDYETYDRTRELFTIRLKSDLVSLSFVFLGFSFEDPNVEYILSRIKNLLGQNARTHYYVTRRPNLPPNANPNAKAQYDYDRRRLDLRVADLQRFGIQTVLIDEFDEITDLLQQLNQQAFLNNIFVSGSAEVGDDAFPYSRLLSFSRKLGGELIRRGFNIISGYGLGVGSEVLVGALERLHRSRSQIQDRLILRPFPRSAASEKKETIYKEWRESMVATAGFGIFVGGNRRGPNADQFISSPGVAQEFELSISKPVPAIPIPVGATGWRARELWKEVRQDIGRFFPHADVREPFEILGDSKRDDDELIKAIFAIIGAIRDGKPVNTGV